MIENMEEPQVWISGKLVSLKQIGRRVSGTLRQNILKTLLNAKEPINTKDLIEKVQMSYVYVLQTLLKLRKEELVLAIKVRNTKEYHKNTLCYVLTEKGLNYVREYILKIDRVMVSTKQREEIK